MAVERVRVAINGYGVIGKRVADAVALMDDMAVAGVADVGWCGLALDASLNESAVGREMEIGAATSRLRVFVIPTGEALLIARDTAACLARPRPR